MIIIYQKQRVAGFISCVPIRLAAATLRFLDPCLRHRLAEVSAFLLCIGGQLGRRAGHEIQAEIVEALPGSGHVERCGDIARVVLRAIPNLDSQGARVSLCYGF